MQNPLDVSLYEPQRVLCWNPLLRTDKVAEKFGLSILVAAHRSPQLVDNPTIRTDFRNTLLERDEDGMLVAECPSIPGCISEGKTEEEALENIREAIIGCLEVRAEQGMPLTVAVREVEVALQ